MKACPLQTLRDMLMQVKGLGLSHLPPSPKSMGNSESDSFLINKKRLLLKPGVPWTERADADDVLPHHVPVNTVKSYSGGQTTKEGKNPILTQCLSD